ncbi:MAG: bifunctional glutamate N-acetyltransferase/amino-acid acetyltransferase ArgJ [Actinobacteria bacterium]|nr:bifunctional glutamate N-acetyltransferase/amino-acid acetyltransferase ArgJ [Actinomycetota bacterium]
MSVDGPKGFLAYGVTSGLKGKSLDLALVLNSGPLFNFAAVFTTNEVKAAPVLWSTEIAKTGKCKAILLNSGGANACTGSEGFSVTHKSAEYVAEKFQLAPIDVAICSTGIIGEVLDFSKIKNGIDELSQINDSDGQAAALAIMTTDSKPKQTYLNQGNYAIGGMAKGAGMLAPSLATMLVVITSDADVSDIDLQRCLKLCVERTFNRISADGCTSTNDSVLLLCNGASRYKPSESDFLEALMKVCDNLAIELIQDAEGATTFVEIIVENARTEEQAIAIARKVAGDSLVKTAFFGRDPNWGRVAAAVGSAKAGINPELLDIYFNGIPVCLSGAANGNRRRVKLDGRSINVVIKLNLGNECATVRTTDLSTEYVLENSEYSS